MADAKRFSLQRRNLLKTGVAGLAFGAGLRFAPAAAEADAIRLVASEGEAVGVAGESSGQ